MEEDVKKEPDSQQEEGKRETSIPNDGSYVPRERLNEVLGQVTSLKSQLDQATGQISVLQKPSTPEPEYTRSELGQKVESGAMTQDEAGRVLDIQHERRTQRTVDAAVNIAVSTATQGQGMQAEFDRYMAAVPEAGEVGTEARGKLQREFDYLTKVLKRPGGVETEVMALRAAFGEVGLIKTGKPVKETHQETGGGEPDEGGGTSDGPPEGLSRDAKKHYGAQIERGMYPDWAAVSKELEAASPSVKQRLGI